MVDEIFGELGVFSRRHEMARVNARAHLIEKRHRHVSELAAQPIVNLDREVFVSPERRKAGSICEARVLAHGIVALVVRGTNEEVDDARPSARRVIAPLRIEVGQIPSDGADQIFRLKPRAARNYRMQRDGVADDRRHLRQKPGDDRHHKARGTLTVNEHLEALRAGLSKNFMHCRRVIENRSRIERPLVGSVFDACAPVQEPDVEACCEERVDAGFLIGRQKNIGAYARTVHKHHRFAEGRGTLERNAMQTEREPVKSLEPEFLTGQPQRKNSLDLELHK